MSVAMLVLWRTILGEIPSDKKGKLLYLEHSSFYSGILLLLAFLSLVLVWLDYRRDRQVLLDEATANMKELIDGTLQDHASKHER